MPWAPELFSAPLLDQIKTRWDEEDLVTVPYFDGLLADEPDALVDSFAGEPVVHDPVRGRVRGRRAFAAYAADTKAWLQERNVEVQDVGRLITGPRGFGEVLLHLDGADGRIDLPYAIVSDRAPDGRIEELRLYASQWSLTGRHLNRPPLLQPDPSAQEGDVVGDYQRALAAGDVDAIVATFEPDGSAREPAGGAYLHTGTEALRAFYALLFSNGGGIPLEHCTVLDDGRACMLEYNVVRWGRTELSPQAGVSVYVRGDSGKLAAARIYDDVDPPL
jgi:hypothetical protein